MYYRYAVLSWTSAGIEILASSTARAVSATRFGQKFRESWLSRRRPGRRSPAAINDCVAPLRHFFQQASHSVFPFRDGEVTSRTPTKPNPKSQATCQSNCTPISFRQPARRDRAHAGTAFLDRCLIEDWRAQPRIFLSARQAYSPVSNPLSDIDGGRLKWMD